jgi:Na+/H+ antiporter NhaD/arsenite permease-like protein
LVCDSLLRARRDPIPYLVALATASNIGSAATIIGNPQNMYIGTVAGLRFGHFALTMLPATLAGLALCYLAIASLFRRRLYGAAGADIEMAWTPGAHESETLVPTSLPLQTSVPQADAYLIVKTLTVLGIVVCCFLVARGPNAPQSRAIAALVGAGVLLCSHRAKAARLYQFVDWNLILLFLGLFVVNGAMTEHGLSDALLGGIRRGGVRLDQPLELSAVTLALSNLVSNVPAVLLLQPTIHIATAATHSDYLWYLLALVSTWAGNLTLVGSIANLIVAESAAAYGVNLSLKTYCTVGIPLTLATIGLGTGWLVWIHRIGWL